MEIKKTPITNEIEKRTFEFRVEKREDGKQTIVGHAAVFNEYAKILWWEERIMPGAFTDSIPVDDVRALFNHDPNIVLGRNKSGTLSMREDERGLFVEIVPPDTQQAKDLMHLIDRGDVSQMSFAFQVIEDKWTYSEDEKSTDKRDIEKVKLYDVSPVTYPAFEGTDVALARRSKALGDIEAKQAHSLKVKNELINELKRRYR